MGVYYGICLKLSNLEIQKQCYEILNSLEHVKQCDVHCFFSSHVFGPFLIENDDKFISLNAELRTIKSCV